MFSERSGPHVPQTEASVAGVALRRRGPLLLEVRSTPLPRPRTLHLLKTTPPPGPFVPPSFPILQLFVCTYVRARLLTRVSRRSPPRGRLASRGDARLPPVDFTAFIWPDEWSAALSVPLPATSSGSLDAQHCLQHRSPSTARTRSASFTHTHKHRQLHTDNTIVDVQFRKRHTHEQQCSNCSSQKLCGAVTHTKMQDTHTHGPQAYAHVS